MKIRTAQIRTTLFAVLPLTVCATVLLTVPGCAVQRGQESVGAYVDDATITSKVKAKFIEDKQVDAAAITVETLKGAVVLSGFAKSTTERDTAERLARDVKGVTSVRNNIVVRP